MHASFAYPDPTPIPKSMYDSISIDLFFILFFTPQEYRKTNDEEAAVLVASRTASTVIDAANAVEVSRLVFFFVYDLFQYVVCMVLMFGTKDYFILEPISEFTWSGC